MRLVDASGNIVAEYTYDPYGNILTATGDLAQINPLRYRGYYYDTELGMYYLNSRYYDPKVGRFINADSLASTGQGALGFNMFAYCENNPANFIDFSGNIMVGALGGPLDSCRAYSGGYVPPQSSTSGGTHYTIPTSFALIEEEVPIENGIKRGSLFDVEVSGYSFGDGGFNLFSIDASVISLDAEKGNFTLSFCDLGNISASLGINNLPYASVMVSLWSPSVSFDVFGKTITAALHIGALGAEFSADIPNFKVGYANGFGFSFGVS